MLFVYFLIFFFFFFCNDTATTEIYTYLHTLSLHDALPIYLVELVTDQHHRTALVEDDLSQGAEQLLGLRQRQHGGRLVEDEDRRVTTKALDDLHALSLTGCQLVETGEGVDVKPVPLGDLRDVAERPLAVETTGLAEGDVLPDRQGTDDAEVLVHHGDAHLGRGEGVLDHHRATVDEDGAGIGRQEPEQHLHESGLAGTVLTEQAVDLTARDAQVDAGASDDLPEPLGDPLELDRRTRGGGGLPGDRTSVV